VTATIVNWLPLFSNPAIVQIVINSLGFLQAQDRLKIIAYVIMENHIHLVAFGKELAKELGDFKSFTARQSIDYYQQQGNAFILDQLAYNKLPNRIDREYQFWQEGVHPQQIKDETMLRQKVDYIHNNPVRRGYVELPEHWRYSSARNFLGMEGVLEVWKEW
jgi:REP element-mobilizing transposase RayT